jgi:alkanesulfonate monooxygenase SsuD/methylene tetrahydromethanopterin reductase-like flavin-dependent oxidoreductase (luciferase family)
VQSLPIVKCDASRYRAAAAQASRTPFICLMRDAVIANSMPEAEAESGPTMYTHRFYFQYGAYMPDEYLKDVTRPEDLSFIKAAQDRLIVGSPADCLEQLQRWQAEIQPDYLIIRFRQPGGPTHQKTPEDLGSDPDVWRAGDSEAVDKCSAIGSPRLAGRVVDDSPAIGWAGKSDTPCIIAV